MDYDDEHKNKPLNWYQTTKLTIQVNAHFLLQLNHHHVLTTHKKYAPNNEFSAEKGAEFSMWIFGCRPMCVCVCASNRIEMNVDACRWAY